MTTEDVSPRYADLDRWDTADIVRALFEAQLAAVASVGSALPAIAEAGAEAAERLRAGGRLIYAGAGTSARIAVQDGAELAPTFGWPHERLAFAIAGGEQALLRAIENAEDIAADGAARMAEIGPLASDVVIGVAASGETVFTCAAIEAARAAGALAIGLANSPGSRLLRSSDRPILVDTGAEPIAGSTRLKAGTAQKAALNILSTLVMVRLGRVYGAWMVCMRPSNAKLRRRAERMVMAIAGAEEAVARTSLVEADDDIRMAALIASGLDIESARAALERHEGNLRAALDERPARSQH